MKENETTVKQAVVRTYSDGGCDALAHYLDNGYVVVNAVAMMGDKNNRSIIEYIVQKEK